MTDKIKFRFDVDKETCFVTWAQFLIKKKHTFTYIDEQESYYRNRTGKLDKSEEEAVAMLQRIYDNDRNGLWLAKRCIGEKIEDPLESQDWQLIRGRLNRKFEEVWAEEEPLLLQWQNTLRNYPLEEFNPLLESSLHFWGVQTFKEEVIAKLFFYWKNDFVKGLSYRGIDNFILLGISHAKLNMEIRAVGTLMHEVVHLMENKSPLSTASFAKFFDDIQKAGLAKEESDWRYLFNESIIKSISSGGSPEDYAFRSIFYKKAKLNPAKNEFIVRANETHNAQVRWVTTKILDTTTEYLNSNKQIDQFYIDVVANAWAEMKGLIRKANVS